MRSSRNRETPGPGQESVWDYPRPPRIDPAGEHVVVTFGGRVVAETDAAVRVLETSHPPVYYVPRQDFAEGALEPAQGSSFCEFKGVASYLSIRADAALAPRCAWFYPQPVDAYAALADMIAIYPAAMDECSVDGEVVRAQDGDFYGGWITDRVVGPFKGATGTLGW